MRKSLLVFMGLCAFSAVFAGTDSTVSGTPADGVRNRSGLIRPGADGRVTVTPDMITGIQAVKERMNAPFKSQEIIDKLEAEKVQANMNFLQNEVRNPENGMTLKMQSDKADTDKSRVAASKPGKAPLKGGSYYHKDQWSQPYQAIGSDLTLSHIDLMISVKSGAFQKFGDRVFTYDADGDVVAWEYTIRNVNGLADEITSWNVKIPENAIIKMINIDNDTLDESRMYYIDPLTNECHDIYIYRSVYYDGDEVSMIRKELDQDGNLVEQGKLESEFDAQGRPVVSIRYSLVTITNTSTGAQRKELRPRSKTEYEYLDNGLVTKTESSMEFDSSTNENRWTYNRRWTEGTDSEGTYNYEYFYFSSYNKDWVGSSKYTRADKETADGGSEVTQTNWRWNSTDKVWQLSDKQFSRYNSCQNRTLSESYNYSVPLGTFYLTSVYGYEYIGDTARCGDWYIRYNMPDSIQQLENQMSLVSYGNRNEYADYTLEELGWTGYPDYRSLPRKYEIRYTLDRENKESISWKEQSKVEYDYKMVTLVDETDPEALMSGQRDFTWKDNAWTLNNEYRYDYNDHGDNIMEERYVNGQISSRHTTEYVYYNRVYSGGYSNLERKVIAEKYWGLSNGELVPTSEYAYAYDKDYNNQILYSYMSSWDAANNRWYYGNKYESEYDGNGRQILSVSYSWSYDRGIWIGFSKEASVFDADGETLKRENWINRSDTSTVWIPSYAEVVEYDDYGQLTSNWYCSGWMDGSWQSGTRYDYSYSADGLLLSESQSYMSSGQWRGTYKIDYEYNDKGQIILSQISENYSKDADEWVARDKDVYSYTDTDELLEHYKYSFDGIEWQNYQKELALIENGVITAYVDSVYDFGYEEWFPSTMTTITRDEATGIVTSQYQNWDQSEEKWNNDRIESVKYDSEGRVIYTESYYWASWYDYETYTEQEGWLGDNMAEFAYNDKGERVMTATYYWDRYDSLWVGNSKNESDYDEFDHQILYGSYYWDNENREWIGSDRYINEYDSIGNQILSISYSWDDILKDWVAESKNEYGYDENGNQIMNAYYSTDPEGDWIGSDKYISYTKDNVYYRESYEWDYDRKDWYGTYKSEYEDSDDYYMSASYEWDYNNWCWVGSEKRVETYTANGQETIVYQWDSASETWVASSKEVEEMTATASSTKFVHTVSLWNAATSGWVFTSRETEEEVYKSDDNMDYSLMEMDIYNPLTSAWVQSYSIKQVYVYKSLTGVEAIPAELNIRVDDGLIIVNADADSAISIASVSGAQVAGGKGSVEASVAPGIYLISVGDKTVKVVVR